MHLPYRYAFRWAFAILLPFCFLIMARAQTVRYEEPVGSLAREGNRAAEEQSRTDWADLRNGETGTRVVLSGDLGNADATIYTNISFGIEPLLAESQKIANHLHLPETDFIVYKGRKTTHGVDLEFNDYLTKDGRKSSSFVLNLADLRDALEASSLPRPITIYDSHDSGDLTTATLQAPGKPSRPVTESFFALRDIADNTTLHYKTKLPWYGYLVASALFGAITLLPPWIEWIGFKNRRKERAKRRANEEAAEIIPDPATVQEQYNKQKPAWVYMILIPGATLIPILILTRMEGSSKALSAAFAALQSLNISINILPLMMMGVLGISKLTSFLIEKREIKREGEVIPVGRFPEDTVPAWTVVGTLYPMMGGLFALFVLIVFPAFRGALFNLTPNAIWYYMGSVVALTVIGVFVISKYARRLTHYDLPKDHFAHTMIEALTRDTKVRVRNVEVVRSSSLNAYVSIWRTVGFTSRLLREFSPEELRVIIAHEIGHFRAADPARHLLFGLLTTAALLGMWFFATNWVASHYTLSPYTKALLNSPMFSILLVPIVQNIFLGKTRRRAEEVADQFAVDVFHGDGEFVIQTLTKLHTLNASPHQLKPSDEIMSTHPSLTNRVAAIRRYAKIEGVSN